MLKKHKTEEFIKCAVDFPYFCENYIKVFNAVDDGFVPFKLFDYQVRLFEHLENNQNTIFSKFKAGGFTTLASVYCLWLCLFRENQNILWLAPLKAHAEHACKVMKDCLQHIPSWMSGNVLKMKNTNQKSFPDTNSLIFFVGSPIVSNIRKEFSTFVVEECSLVSNMDETWKSIYPCVANGQSIIFSAVNTDTDWFYNTLDLAKLKINKFSVYENYYKEHPDWEKFESHRSKIGVSEWEIEYEQRPLVIEEEVVGEKKASRYRSIFDE